MKYDVKATARIDEFYFDEDTAKTVVGFFENFLVHIKGSQFANQPLTLEPWQKDILVNLFSWKKKSDGTRRFREAYIEIPRKNGKSTLCAGIALFLLYADKEEGAEIYSAAADRSQAGIVFDVAKEMVNRNITLSKMSETYRNSIVYGRRASSYKAISADAYSKHGFNAHGIIFDELHAQPNRELYDVLLTSTGSRLQPLMVSITTAGYDRNSICWEKHDYSIKIIEGVIDDPTFFPVIFAAEPEDDWKKPATWAKANPNMGISISEEYLFKECQKAIEIPSYENTFRRLHLNQWTEQDVRWIPMDIWRAVEHIKVDTSELKNVPCWLGIDLASTTDLCCVAQLFPWEDGIVLKPHFWLPEEKLEMKKRLDRVPYDIWAKQGLLTLTQGNVVDYTYIEMYLDDLANQFKIQECGYDPWNAIQFAINLAQKGHKMVEVRQGFRTMNEPSKQFIGEISNKKVYHQGHPILTWNASNAVVSSDPAGNIKPDKAKSTGRIDGLVASIIAYSRYILTKNINNESVYKERGLISL